MSEHILVVERLRKTYDKQMVVKDISFTVRTGEVFGILGPNGAGKTTTLEMIETLRPIDGGQVTLDGKNVAKSAGAIREIIGVQTQSSSFYDRITIREQLILFGRIYGRDIDVDVLLNDVGLKEKAGSYPEKLSGGQRQRFSIAMALVNEPKILFLDEPTTGLDPQSRRNLWELIQRIQARGITVILTTHYMEEAQVLCDRVAIMDNGKLVALDEPNKLISSLLATGFKKETQVQQADLEDVFINLTGKALRD